MASFWDYSVWGFFNLFAVLLLSLLAANALKRLIPALQASLIPTPVLGGALLLIISVAFESITGKLLFNTRFFGGTGANSLEVITYHALALGFIASALKISSNKLTKKRSIEIFNSGVTTVGTYLLQAVFGLGISIAAAALVAGLFPAAGLLLPFGFGQGTGQALNYGTIYELEYGFTSGKSFGLTIAALGFLSASIGGVIHLNILKRQGKISTNARKQPKLRAEDVQSENDIPLQDSVDRLTIQVALVLGVYLVSYFIMCLLGMLLPGMRSVIFGFNFLIGVLIAALVKLLLGFMRRKGLVKKQYINNFLLTRASNLFFDIMVVAGIAAIRLNALEAYWGEMLILAVTGLIITYFYNRKVAYTLFPEYPEEQFLTMYGMLTGTASTGVVLLREIDGELKTPAADNMVYQTLPAIVFGFPIMLLATLAPKAPLLTLGILAVLFVVMNIILFRSVIFKKLKKR